MRIIIWALWLLLFLLFFGFALNNVEVTTLHFFSGWAWQAPLIALLLAFFFAGVVFGFLAMLPTWLRLRLEIRRLKKTHTKEAAAKPADSAAINTVIRAEAIQSVAQGARHTS